MSGGIVSGAAVRDRTPDADDWGLVVRPIGVVPVTGAIYDQRFDIFASNPIYIYVGYADLGAVDAAPVWRIKRITFASGNPTVLVWSGPGFTAIWDDRTTIPYV